MHRKLRGVGLRALVAGAWLAVGAAGCANADLASLPCTDVFGNTCIFTDPPDGAPPASSADASAGAHEDGSPDSSDGAFEGSADVSRDRSSPSDAALDTGTNDEPKTPQSCYVKP